MLRNLYPTDIAQILPIENAVHVAPWGEETFKTCFQAGYIGWVAELEKKVIGFVIVSLRVEECHVLNIGVAREYQHQGWGRQLMDKALSHAKERGAVVAYLEVRRSNSQAIGLYQNMHFHQVGERKGYYSTASGNEDALVFAMNL